MNAKRFFTAAALIVTVLLAINTVTFAQSDEPETPPAATQTEQAAPEQNMLQSMQTWMGAEAWGQMIQRMTEIHGPEATGQMLARMNSGESCHRDGGMMGGRSMMSGWGSMMGDWSSMTGGWRMGGSGR